MVSNQFFGFKIPKKNETKITKTDSQKKFKLKRESQITLVGIVVVVG